MDGDAAVKPKEMTMGLYNVIFGQQEGANVLLALIDQKQHVNVGRFRDAWVEREGDRPLIRVHTRNGGGNREDYDDGSMTDHPWYVRDADDDYDCTYADWWFAPPASDVGEEVFRGLVALAQEPVDMGQRWRDMIAAMERGGA